MVRKSIPRTKLYQVADGIRDHVRRFGSCRRRSQRSMMRTNRMVRYASVRGANGCYQHPMYAPWRIALWQILNAGPIELTQRAGAVAAVATLGQNIRDWAPGGFGTDDPTPNSSPALGEVSVCSAGSGERPQLSSGQPPSRLASRWTPKSPQFTLSEHTASTPLAIISLLAGTCAGPAI